MCGTGKDSHFFKKRKTGADVPAGPKREAFYANNPEQWKKDKENRLRRLARKER